MKKESAPGLKFTAAISREDRWHVAQCLEIDIASQGRTKKTALKNLADALKLHFVAYSARADS